MGKTGLTHDIFFKFSVGPFEVVEAEGGRLVKEADFEAEKQILLKKNNLALYAPWQLTELIIKLFAGYGFREWEKSALKGTC